MLQLRDYVRRLAGAKPAHSPEEQFNHLYTLRKWIFWVPAISLKTESQDYLMLIMLSYFYATALVLEPLFPNVAPAFCSRLCRRPLVEILRTFDQLESTSAHGDQRLQNMLMLLQFPKQVLATHDVRNQEQMEVRISPPAFDNMDFEASSYIDPYGVSRQRSPLFGPAALHSPRHRASSGISSSTSGSPFLDVGTMPDSGLQQPMQSMFPEESLQSEPEEFEHTFAAGLGLDYSGFVAAPMLEAWSLGVITDLAL